MSGSGALSAHRVGLDQGQDAFARDIARIGIGLGRQARLGEAFDEGRVRDGRASG
jgi:hypothetical protein